MVISMRACSRCGEEKPPHAFYKQKDAKFGLSPRCKACAKLERAQKYKENPGKANKASAEWRKNNPDKVKEYERKAAKEAAKKKRAKVASRNGKTTRQIWNEENREKVNASQSASQKKRLSTPKGKIENSIRAGMWRGLLAGGKEGKSTFDVLGYTPMQLMAHLEALFTCGMSWENYGRGKGKWSIDHKVPLAAHNYTKVSDPEFKLAWSLSNLQPLWSTENSAKGPRISDKYFNTPANDNEEYKMLASTTSQKSSTTT